MLAWTTYLFTAFSGFALPQVPALLAVLASATACVAAAVMLACVFVGLYCFRVSYAVMAFAVTTLMGLLHEVLHEFSDQLLGLRVAETAVGAAVGVAVALLVLPVRTADARAAAQRAFLAELAELLADVRVRLEAHGRTSDLHLGARRLDARLLQLVLVARPAGGPGARPDLARPVEALREHVTGAAGPPGPVRAATATGARDAVRVGGRRAA